MAVQEEGLFSRGFTYKATAITDGNRYEGMERYFDDRGNLTQPGARTVGNRLVKCRLVRNTSGGALLPGHVVPFNYANGTPGTQVNADAGALAIPGGVVDEWLPAAGVANNDLFWLVIEGISKVLVTTGTTIALGDVLVTNGSGAVATIAAAPATPTAAQQAVLGRVGTAIQAVTTAAAGAQILVDVGRYG